MTLDATIYLSAPEEVLTQRLLDRASEGGRADDKADVIRRRLRIYAELTGPLVPYYRERGILITVDANQSPESVTADIQSGLSGLSVPGGVRTVLPDVCCTIRQGNSVRQATERAPVRH